VLLRRRVQREEEEGAAAEVAKAFATSGEERLFGAGRRPSATATKSLGNPRVLSGPSLHPAPRQQRGGAIADATGANGAEESYDLIYDETFAPDPSESTSKTGKKGCVWALPNKSFFRTSLRSEDRRRPPCLIRHDQLVMQLRRSRMSSSRPGLRIRQPMSDGLVTLDFRPFFESGSVKTSLSWNPRDSCMWLALRAFDAAVAYVLRAVTDGSQSADACSILWHRVVCCSDLVKDLVFVLEIRQEGCPVV
jgi:hypothetical protein